MPIKEMVDAVINKDVNTFQKEFKNSISLKAHDKIESMRKEMAKNLFKESKSLKK